MSKEDKQVIDMANSSGERLERDLREKEEHLQHEARYQHCVKMMKAFKRRQRLKAMIPALLCCLSALALLAQFVTGNVAPQMELYTAAVMILCAATFGYGLSEALRY